MRERQPWLRASGLLTRDEDEVIVVRAQKQAAATSRLASRCLPHAGG